jgi:hypothetical protein
MQSEPRRLKPECVRVTVLSAGLVAMTGVTALAWSASAQAQTALSFPSGNSGYDQQLGVTVQSRARPLYDPLGIKLGSFTVRPEVDQTIFDNSSVNGTPGSGSWGSQTSAMLSAQSDWSRNSLGGSIGVNQFEYFSLPNQNHTDWNIGLGGGYTIGDNQLTAAYSHQSFHQLGTAIGTVQSATPVLDQTDTAELGYGFDFGRFTVTPNLSVSAYRFGAATVGDQTQSQDFLNRDVIAGTVTTSYAAGAAGNFLLVVGGSNSHYIEPQPGQPSNDSTSLEVLGGLDYQTEGLWRYSLLAGVETRTFAASQYATETAPVIAANVIWTPTGVLTATGNLSRVVADPELAGSSGNVLNQAGLVLDYELLRNVLLQARGSVQYVQYLQAGTQSNLSVGGGVTWLLNRDVRLSVEDDYTQQFAADGMTTNTANAANFTDTTVSGQYSQNIFAITLRVAF